MVNEYVSRIKLILTKPSDFFKQLEKEKGYKKSLSFYAVMSLINAILALVGVFILNPQLFQSSQFSKEFSATLFGPALVIGYIVSIILSFVFAWFIHMWIRIFKAQEDYQKTYQLYVYTRTPKFVIGWLPLLNIIAEIWCLYLLILGTHKIHKIGMKKTAIIYIIPTILLTILGFVVAYYAASLGIQANQ